MTMQDILLNGMEVIKLFRPRTPEDISDEDFKKYVLRLKQIIHHIDVFQFLGGEPLLQDDIGECIKFLHCVYPITKIVIYTNGLLIKSMSDELLQIIKDYNVEIIMSKFYDKAPLLGAATVVFDNLMFA